MTYFLTRLSHIISGQYPNFIFYDSIIKERACEVIYPQ